MVMWNMTESLVIATDVCPGRYGQNYTRNRPTEIYPTKFKSNRAQTLPREAVDPEQVIGIRKPSCRCWAGQAAK